MLNLVGKRLGENEEFWNTLIENFKKNFIPNFIEI